MAKAKKRASRPDADWPASAFWDFSLALYRRPGVEAACLALQDRRGLDVNLLLWSLWLAECGVALDQAILKRAKTEAVDWQMEIVGPLRDIMRRLRQRIDHTEPDGITGRWPDRVDALRRDLLALELDGEHLAQLALGRIGDRLKPSRRASAGLAGDNLACLGGFDEGDRGDLANLLKQAFPDAHHARVDAALDVVFKDGGFRAG